jgi:hypothetical protein
MKSRAGMSGLGRQHEVLPGRTISPEPATRVGADVDEACLLVLLGYVARFIRDRAFRHPLGHHPTPGT